MATSSTTISPERRNSSASSTPSSSSMKISVSAASLADLNTGGEDDENPGITYKTAERGPKKVNQYILGELLGEGAYGKVREAIDSRTLKRVAIKIIKRTKLKRIKGAEENLRNEINILRRMKHDNVIRLIEVIHNEDKQKIYIITEFAGAGSLQQVIESHLPHKRLPPADAHHFFKQMILGLEYIHNQGVIHRDIKPSNLMITPDRVLKISDFGVARELGFFDKDDLVSNSFGSPAFQSPQIASGQKNFSGYKLDIWAAGVTLYNMVTGTTPFAGDNVFDLFEQIAKGQYTIPEYVPESIKSLIRGMLEKDEDTRFTIQQIKEHEWFKQSSLSTDKPVPLVERWKSHSLVPYIAKAVGGSSGSSSSSPNPSSTTIAAPEKRNSISLSSLAGRRKSIFLPSFKADSNFAEGEDPLQGENPKCNIL